MNSEKKALLLLDKQINKLDEEPFDLEAWKSGAQSLITLLLGAGHQGIGQIQALKVDYSSWALRDATSRYNPLITCKLMGKEILENAKAEIELYGLQRQHPSKDSVNLASLLSSAEHKRLTKALATTTDEKRVAAVNKVVSKWKPERTVEVLTQILSAHPAIIS